MRAITETELRDAYKKAEFISYTLPEGCRLTPAAAQFLSERRIPVHKAGASSAVSTPKPGKQEAYSVSEMKGKPEHMTHLNGRNLVLKNHPRIKFRGKIDTFEALLINAILEIEGVGYQELGRDLREVLNYVRQILRAEVKEEPLAAISFHGWPESEIRDRSHHPQKYFGVNHLLPNPEQGVLMAKLNYLRTQARELELAAMDAFPATPEKMEREDIIQALNRLSSLIYIMMVQLVSGHYRVGC
ncbi:MAG: cobalamin adenosyltransferase [Bacillota bacterium]|jgi:ethanolamine utilization cobalamin adenosyltransferase